MNWLNRLAGHPTATSLLLFFALALSLSLTSCGNGKPNAFDRSGYHVRGGTVWYLPNWTSEPFQVSGADVATFEFPLPKGTDADFARDAHHVYLSGKVIPSADPATFEIFDERFTRDANNVYFSHHIFCDDPKNFTRVSGNFVKNSHSVYHITQQGRGEVFSEDPASFHQISLSNGYSFCADKHTVYVNGNPIPGAQPATFKVIDESGYSRDATQAFYFKSPMPPGTDKDTLQHLAEGYAKDRARVYYLGKVLEGADAPTFEITDPKWPKAKDKHRSYEQGNAVP